MARRQYEHQEYPKRVWHPETGRYKDAAGPGDVPEGWLTRHPMDPVHALPTGEDGDVIPPPPVVEPPQTLVPAFSTEDRAGIITALKDRRVAFNARASTASLAGLLNEVVAREG